jgi:hypothetical protein
MGGFKEWVGGWLMKKKETGKICDVLLLRIFFFENFLL